MFTLRRYPVRIDGKRGKNKKISSKKENEMSDTHRGSNPKERKQ